ncbi:DHA2 family efflux MFS transporter permease subunit [Pseudomonas fragi]|uniref:DHA2 family efflux MFS transporter permease subunit n=1 Tax=Pseudomonas fragi TaxID=296 RepID=UPI001065F958|nr:DHA2 family efflux MFS transporter permease subunit [Pseudomonas fragi]NNB09141.1 DHA2 family efflux MFS transporter permease subunit [Pseudomonas fragi]NNB29329.1 DHA2 family efflux MFS transporter permease subunit [Pseudomonas fragi]NNB38441.1 DHA2 family efflux MFS transporter permease subunit [Pseudomonas fragi]NNB58491.1 DHA2 family efflux MFS transporter permease subunit [Pseudomonas fragi]
MASAAAASAALQPPRANASTSDWIVVFAGALGALMATLDISITNSALPQIQGQIGASGTEGTWISTGYLMAEIVMIPLTAWLTRVFGLRNFLIGNAILFSLFSILCGISETLPQMIIGRLGQGFAGGAMIPTAQVLVATRLPRHQMPIGMTMFGLIVLLGPLLGPVLGGTLTENFSWRWCFFLNIPVCALLLLMLGQGLNKTAGDWQAFIKADWLGIIGLTVGLSALTVVLEEGNRERWFESSHIIGLSLLAVAGIALLLVAQKLSKTPIVRLKLLLNPRFASVIAIVFVVGCGLYCVAFVLPQFLSNIAGFNAQQSGAVMLMSGLPAFLMMPVLPRLIGRVDTRIMVMLGLGCLASSCLLAMGLTADSVGDNFTRTQLLLGLGQVMAMMPLNQASMSCVPAHEAGEAAGIYNMARNLGGSVGLALLGTFIERRSSFHDATLRDAVSVQSVEAQTQLAASAQGFFADHGDLAHAQLQALSQLAGQIQVQAQVMTYSETFYVLGIALLLCLPLALFLKKPPAGTPLSTGH